ECRGGNFQRVYLFILKFNKIRGVYTRVVYRVKAGRGKKGKSHFWYLSVWHRGHYYMRVGYGMVISFVLFLCSIYLILLPNTATITGGMVPWRQHKANKPIQVDTGMGYS